MTGRPKNAPALTVKEIMEDGWLYYVSPDSNTMVRIRNMYGATWERELFILRPKFRLGHPRRVVEADTTYPLPESFSHWTELTKKAATATLLQGFGYSKKEG